MSAPPQAPTVNDIVIKGDVPPHAKDLFHRWVEVFSRERDGKLQARVTYRLTVAADMLNWNGSMHGGCAVYLIDVCSSAAISLLAMVQKKPWGSVSQALNTSFHAPALAGVTIEVVNTTTASGSRMLSSVTEIWDVTNSRLCMSGTHHKMAPSKL
ncbi:uncharacterized protein BXZ73DRAFT_106098 [Epithele typhae]|uniref:uncharacterized protein n=1 Tax=Epithele typhae TaxID=378194 RepID=UPI002008B056|nr:uncharacterized protein BXZ73DRAFT_106098 [Epithele typhae]KAH9915549.1 hypothetical protein BXZ73DRAFT_106098 [Epithele typhae]